MAQETNLPPASSETPAPVDGDSSAAELMATNEAATNKISLPEASNTGWNNPQPIVLFGQNAELKAGDTAETVVVIGGSAAIHGQVHEAVVVIGGDLRWMGTWAKPLSRSLATCI